MPGPEPLLFQAVSVFGPLPPISGVLLAYGPAPGVELIPYFLGLAAWAGLAFLAVLLSPFSALLRRLRGTRNATATGSNNEARTAPRPESTGEDNRNGT
jgi:hypothetical protein